MPNRELFAIRAVIIHMPHPYEEDRACVPDLLRKDGACELLQNILF